MRRRGSSLDQWCRDVLGAGVATELFASGHLADVLGVRLDDGRRVVLKVRPGSSRLEAVVRAQRHFYEAGVPCPRPLAGPLPFNGLTITAEELVAADRPPATEPSPDLCADLLARVVEAAPSPQSVPELDGPPPWVGWDHGGAGVWPPPDDLDVDLNSVANGDWIDDAARSVRLRLAEYIAPEIVGHVDWEARNLGWRDERPVVVYDWDSLAIRTEAALVGAAATVFGSTEGLTVAASVVASDAFLDEYRHRRGPFTDEQVEVAWSAGLWILLYNAKKEMAGGGRGYLAHLERELLERMQRAGL